MGIKKPRYKSILTPTLSLKERVVGYGHRSAKN